jgi:hypothetical protein
VLIWIVCWLHIRDQRETKVSPSGFRLTVEFVAVALTLLTAHVGGFVSGVNGPG